MIVSGDTPKQLTLTHRPVVLVAALCAGVALLLALAVYNLQAGNAGKAFLIGLATVLVAGPCLWFGAETVTVVFDADENTCTFRTRRLSGEVSQVLPLADIERAMVQTHKGQSDSKDAHRVALVLGENRVENRRPLTTGYSSGPQAARAVDSINDWLKARRDAADA